MTNEALEAEQVVAEAVDVRADRGVKGGDEELGLGPQSEGVRVKGQVKGQIHGPVELEQRHGHQNGPRAALDRRSPARLGARSLSGPDPFLLDD